MNQPTSQDEYQAILNAENILSGSHFANYPFFDFAQGDSSPIDKPEKELIFGKKQEYWVKRYLERHYELLLSNHTINNDKISIGELDFLFRHNEELIHLELACKFYLYDPTLANAKLNAWIGPRRKDSLLEKLNKLKKKQFPLLHSNRMKADLSKLGYESNQFKQYLALKGILFTPYFRKEKLDLNGINPKAIKGKYLDYKDIPLLLEEGEILGRIPKSYWLCADYYEEYTPSDRHQLVLFRKKDLSTEKIMLVHWS